jgi:hypothetical protein
VVIGSVRQSRIKSGYEHHVMLKYREKTQRFLKKRIFFAFCDFYIILHFDDFVMMRYIDFLNLLLIKNLKIDSSFFYHQIRSVFDDMLIMGRKRVETLRILVPRRKILPLCLSCPFP